MSTCSQVLQLRTKIYNQQGKPKTIDDTLREAHDFDDRLLRRVHHLPMIAGRQRQNSIHSASRRSNAYHHRPIASAPGERATPSSIEGVNAAITRHVRRRLRTKTAIDRRRLRPASGSNDRISPTDTLNDLSSDSGPDELMNDTFDEKMGNVKLQSLLRRSTIAPIVNKSGSVADNVDNINSDEGKRRSSEPRGIQTNSEDIMRPKPLVWTVDEHPECKENHNQDEDHLNENTYDENFLQAPLSSKRKGRRRSSNLGGAKEDDDQVDHAALEMEFGACGGRDASFKDAIAHAQKMKESEDYSPDDLEQRRGSVVSGRSVTSNKFTNLSPTDKLRRAIKTISLLLKATTTSAEQSKRHGAKFMTSSGGGSDRKGNKKETKPLELDFDISYFKARREKTLSVEAIRVLKTHPRMRTEEQLRVALIALTDTVEAFGEFPSNMQESLVRVGWYERYGSKRVIIRQSHAAQNFYFIISGITVVTIAKKNDSSGESFGATIAMLKKGNSFGELALMSGGKRNATVSCMNEVELLSVTREDFIDIFMNLQTNTEPEHISFLREVPMLREWPIDTLPYDDPKICLFTYFRRGTVLCRNSNEAEWVYVIRTGSCFIMKDLPAMHDGLARLKCKSRIVDSVGANSLEEFEDPGEGRLVRKPKGRVYAGTDISSKIDGMIHKKRGGKLSTNEKVFIKLKVLRAREVFGLEPLAFNCLGGTTGVTLVSDGAECVLINVRFFKKRIDQNYAKILRQELQPFPEIEDLEQKLQGHYNWNAYRHIVMDYYNRDKPKIHNFSPFT